MAANSSTPLSVMNFPFSSINANQHNQLQHQHQHHQQQQRSASSSRNYFASQQSNQHQSGKTLCSDCINAPQV
jgi:hypothetical protein